MRRTGRFSSVQTSRDAAPAPRTCQRRYASVRPVSTRSSTMTTSRPSTSTSRSLRIRTRPESGAYREMARKSTVTSISVIGAHQVGEEDQRSLEHADEHDTVGMIAGDSTGDALDVRADGTFVDQHGRRRFSLVCVAPVTRRASRVRRGRGTPIAKHARAGTATPAPVAPWRGLRGSVAGCTAASPARRAQPRVRRSACTYGGAGR